MLTERSSRPLAAFRPGGLGIIFILFFCFCFLEDSSAGRDADLQLHQAIIKSKVKETSGQRESLQKLTGILLVRAVRAERRRRSEIYSMCTSSPNAGSHLERGSTRPTATVGTACVYLFIPGTAAPAISVRRFPNAARRHMTQQPSVHLAGMRALPSLRANRRARIPSAISLIGRLIQFWPWLISFLERRC